MPWRGSKSRGDRERKLLAYSLVKGRSNACDAGVRSGSTRSSRSDSTTSMIVSCMSWAREEPWGFSKPCTTQAGTVLEFPQALGVPEVPAPKSCPWQDILKVPLGDSARKSLPSVPASRDISWDFQGLIPSPSDGDAVCIRELARISPPGEGRLKTGMTQEKKQSGVRSVPQKEGERTKTSGKEKEKEEKT